MKQMALLPPTLGQTDRERAMRVYTALASGGFEEQLYFLIVDGEPPSKARPRFSRAGHAYTPAKQREQERVLKARLAKSFPAPLTGNVAIGCVFFRSSFQRVDVDNMLKHVLDSATGTCWVDDSQVTAVAGFVELDRKHPRTIIVVGLHQSTMKRESTLLEGVCETCGKGFTYPHWRKTRKRFCSSRCVSRSRGQDLSELVPCRHCATPFKRMNSRSTLCSSECRIAWMRGKKQAARAPLNTCDDCGKQLANRGADRCRECWRTARSKGLA
jgi:Holliday junction resolvase RusA-like endonuclease